MIVDAAVAFLVVLVAVIVAWRIIRGSTAPDRFERRYDQAAIDHHERCILMLNRLHVYDELVPILPTNEVRAEIGRLLAERPKEIPQ